ncbi:MAG: hypothetical protein M0R17_04625 [Candidatus Omnitrophica bacterium]|jgi:hypothetical protein|nr:hypothetical protein [Candidatus Omnitrophota bacterium]
MEILIKKGSAGDKTTTSIKEIGELLDLTSIKTQLQYLKSVIEETKRLPKLEKDTLLPILKDEFINKGELINLTFPASIEKDEKIKIGSVYYNSVKDTIRIKKKSGWTNLI